MWTEAELFRQAPMADRPKPQNVDEKTVRGFGAEWAAFDQTKLDPDEQQRLFSGYFSCFPFEGLPVNAEGFDLGCGSGRWAILVAPKVGLLHCIDPAPEALNVARRRLQDYPNVRLHLATADDMPVEDSSQDFGYSLGVLHHVPDTLAALRKCVEKLKPGAPFLLYLYYRFENRPIWFALLWRTTDIGRRVISRLPFSIRRAITTAVAAGVYFPLARTAKILEARGRNVTNLPLSAYRNASFYTMRTDALDRFGTRLEQRFTKDEIRALMEEAGLERIVFRDAEPYWVACGYRRT
jgi:ubiquinone/menaquinone biosynthesis C-methylase UbiE